MYSEFRVLSVGEVSLNSVNFLITSCTNFNCRSALFFNFCEKSNAPNRISAKSISHCGLCVRGIAMRAQSRLAAPLVKCTDRAVSCMENRMARVVASIQCQPIGQTHLSHFFEHRVKSFRATNLFQRVRVFLDNRYAFCGFAGTRYFVICT